MQHPMKLKEVKRLNLWEQKTALKSVSTSEISNQLYLLFYCISHCKQIFWEKDDMAIKPNIYFNFHGQGLVS